LGCGADYWSQINNQHHTPTNASQTKNQHIALNNKHFPVAFLALQRDTL